MRYEQVTTTCPYCACGCGLSLQVLDDRIIGVLPSKTSPTNKGKLCIKGWNVHEFVQHSDRLKTPLMREGSTLRKASWEEALGHAAKELRRISETYGPDSIGFLTSARCTNEENYLLQKFARTAIGTNNVDHCARL
jgi:predicted molibdopterin-dependent oxidoreductase YjgC